MIKKIEKILKNKDSLQLIYNMFGNYLVKGGAMIVSLLTTPAYMSYFESQRILGMWFTMSSLLNTLTLFNLGVGKGMRNQLVEPLQKNDREEIKKILSTGYVTIGFLVMCLFCLQFLLVDKMNWFVLLGVNESDISKETLNLTIHIFLGGIILRFLTDLASEILFAMQKAILPGLLTLIANIISLVYMLFAKTMSTEHGILMLAFVHSVAINLPLVVALIVLCFTKLRGSFPNIRYFEKNKIRGLLGTGTRMFCVQILLWIVFWSKELFINWFVGAEQVVYYNVYYKLIGTVSALFSVALTPIWSAVTKAYVNGQNARIRKLHNYGTKVILMLGVIEIGLLILMPIIVPIWLGENVIEVRWSWGLLFCLYNIVYMWMMMNYNFACGMGKIKLISKGLTISAVLNVVLAYSFSRIEQSWIMIVLATIIASIPCCILASGDVMAFTKKEG